MLIKKLHYKFKAISRSNVWIGNDMKKKNLKIFYDGLILMSEDIRPSPIVTTIPTI